MFFSVTQDCYKVDAGLSIGIYLSVSLFIVNCYTSECTENKGIFELFIGFFLSEHVTVT